MPPDSGPFYAETNWDHFIKEPFNGVTAFVFFVIGLIWFLKLRGKAKEHRFTLGCLLLLMLGGIGGSLFHLFRASAVFLYLDFVPIILIGFAMSFWLWEWVLKSRIQAIFAALVFFFLQRLALLFFPFRSGITFSYFLTAAFVAVPLVLILRADKWKDGKIVGTSAGLFAVGLYCRSVDLVSPFPMGTHWLWHLFSAGALWLLISYLVKLEARRRPS